MRRDVLSALAFTVAMSYAPAILAEANEATVGLSGGVLLPALQSPNPTAFTLATWSAGFEVQYGVLESLYLRGSFLVSTFSGTAQTTQEVEGRPYSGQLVFDGAYYHPEVGARLKLFGGYNLAPYAELNAGFLWSVYNKASLKTASGAAMGLEDFAKGSPTLGAGLAVDYRLFNLLFAGIAVRYVHVFGALAHHYVSVPLVVSFYW